MVFELIHGLIEPIRDVLVVICFALCGTNQTRHGAVARYWIGLYLSQSGTDPSVQTYEGENDHDDAEALSLYLSSLMYLCI